MLRLALVSELVTDKRILIGNGYKQLTITIGLIQTLKYMMKRRENAKP